jgi:hypothetical protein
VLGEPLEIGPAQLPRERKCRSEDGPAIVRISFDDFALPSRIEQIGESRRRVLGLDQIGVVTNWAERGERTISMTRPSQHLKVEVPEGRAGFEDIIGQPILGGLHHRYARI